MARIRIYRALGAADDLWHAHVTCLRISTVLALPAVFVAAGLAVAAPASAADYCVNTGCANTSPTFQDALNQAAATLDADRILLGASTYAAPTIAGFDYQAASKVEVIGAGAGQTTITGPSSPTRRCCG